MVAAAIPRKTAVTTPVDWFSWDAGYDGFRVRDMKLGRARRNRKYCITVGEKFDSEC